MDFLVLLQGARGFPGTPGHQGLKGPRVSMKISSFLMKELIFILLLFFKIFASLFTLFSEYDFKIICLFLLLGLICHCNCSVDLYLCHREKRDVMVLKAKLEPLDLR